MTQAKQGDKVRIHYTGKLNDGTVFDSSVDREPLEFTIGEGMVIPGFESAVEGMEVGEEKQISIQPDDAYGESRDDLVVEVPSDQIPESINPEVGMPLELRTQEGESVQVTVSEVKPDSVILDGNHPLAGETLNFDVKLVEIV